MDFKKLFLTINMQISYRIYFTKISKLDWTHKKEKMFNLCIFTQIPYGHN